MTETVGCRARNRRPPMHERAPDWEQDLFTTDGKAKAQPEQLEIPQGGSK